MYPVLVAVSTVPISSPTSIAPTGGMVSIPFFEVYLSAFLGLLSAFAVEAITDIISSRQKRKQILTSLFIELESVKKEADSLEDTKLYPLPYSIPFWKGICSSGAILVLDKIDCFSELVRIFSEIDEANKVEGEFFRIALSSQIQRFDRATLDTILNNRKKLKDEIDSGIRLLKEEKQKWL